ncbi:MAG: hypothetical protein WAL85_15570 [Candidatus Korobacteraceae bacterium]
MKQVLVFGMLLGLLTSVSFAQRGHAVGGVGANPGIPNVGPVSPMARPSPNAITMPHEGVAPNATTVEKNPSRVAPNATTDPTAKTVGSTAQTVGPDAKTVGPTTVTVPDRVITPNAQNAPGPER